MNILEFSNEFDILYNGIMGNTVQGVNEYEKSVFLTQAQEELVKNYFNPRGNKYQEGFDGSAKRQIDFSELVKTGKGLLITTGLTYTTNFDKRAKVFTLPTDVFLIINEALYIDKGGKIVPKQIIPLRFDEYNRLMSKPYKEPLKNQAWRIIANGDLGLATGTVDPIKGVSTDAVMVEIITHTGDSINEYTVRYVSRPRPIILIDLNTEFGDLTINGSVSATDCQLNPLIHREILARAVELARLAALGDLKATVELNQRSE